MRPNIPQDNKPHFRIGNYEPVVDYQKSRQYISEDNHELTTELIACFSGKERERAIADKLLPDYNDDGEIRFYFSVPGVFDHGVPTGSFEYIKEYSEQGGHYMYAQHFDYYLKFHGMTTYRDGWVWLDGQMISSDDAAICFAVDIAMPFDVKQLGWSQYCFTSLEEALLADKKSVCFLKLTNPTFTHLPDVICDFKNLTELSIENKDGHTIHEEPLALSQLPECIGALQSLRSLTISHAMLAQLPNSFIELRALENLSFYSCQLRSLPDQIWQLPRLKSLYLSNNQLTHIPDDIQLPMLETLSISDNQLRTLPASLLAPPDLKVIYATGNPFETLPSAYSNFKGLELSMEEQLRLLDMRYPGADGKGTQVWDNSLFYVGEDVDMMKPVDDIISKNHLEQYKEALHSWIKKAVGFNQTVPEDYSVIGNHRFGGKPDLPLDMDYPSFDDDGIYRYEFMAQINCEAIAALQDYLPRTGTLFFFLQSIHHLYPIRYEPAKVIYVADNRILASAKRFTYGESDFFALENGEYAPYKASAFSRCATPSLYGHRANTYLFKGAASALQDDHELLESLYELFEVPIGDMLPADHAMNTYGFTQHESPELQAVQINRGNPEDWIILLKVSSVGEFCWGDSGDLFFVIHKSDLVKKDFSNVFLTLESS